MNSMSLHVIGTAHNASSRLVFQYLLKQETPKLSCGFCSVASHGSVASRRTEGQISEIMAIRFTHEKLNGDRAATCSCWVLAGPGSSLGFPVSA